MKKNAFLIASLPNVRSASNVFGFLIKKDWRYQTTGILDNTHFRFYTMKSLRRFLKDNNFKTELFKGTRPLSSNFLIFFYLLDIITLGFNHDMKFNGIGIRAIFLD